MLPRIPMVTSAGDFRAFADAGRKLADLRIGYETVEPWPLEILGEPASGVQGDALYDWYRVEKMRYGGKGKEKDRSTVIYNSHITMSGISYEAHEYMLGSRSGVEWVMERYQVKIDTASQIKNDRNDWSRGVEDPRCILVLCRRHESGRPLMNTGTNPAAIIARTADTTGALGTSSPTRSKS